MLAAAAKSLQSCPTLCDPIDGSPPGSPVPGIILYSCLKYSSGFHLTWNTLHTPPLQGLLSVDLPLPARSLLSSHPGSRLLLRHTEHVPAAETLLVWCLPSGTLLAFLFTPSFHVGFGLNFTSSHRPLAHPLPHQP